MKLSEEYFQKNIVDKNDYSFDLIKTYGLIREIEGKIEVYESDNFPEIGKLKEQLTTIRKEAGL